MEEKDKGRLEGKWRRKGEEGKYLEKRLEDHIIAPFECDLCIFIKLRGMHPYETIREDKFLLSAIRRVNLDVFWSGERSMISNNLNNAKKIIKASNEVGLEGLFAAWGAMLDWDYC